jgi:TRAP-type C4-dicarboxylate transport system permease small subunit
VSAGPLPRPAAQASGPLHRLEDALLALLLGALVVLASLQIGLRSLLDTGLPWIDPTLRVLVLWLGLLGAVAASRDGRHITIDVLARLLPTRARAVMAAGTALFTAAVSATVAWHGGRFVFSEFEYASRAFSGIPAWALEIIIPFAFGAIALRYAKLAVIEAHRALRPAPENADDGPGTDLR